MKFIAFLVLLMSLTAHAQWSDTITTVTSGNFDDINPQVDHAGLGAGNYGYAALERSLWVVFERWINGTDAIEAVRFSGSTLKWDSATVTISPAVAGDVQKKPDICSVQAGLSIAAWQVKSDSVWNIEYSVLDTGSGKWSAPELLTDDSVSNTDVKVRMLFDSAFVLVWKRGRSVLFSVYKSGSFSPVRTLVESNTDSTDYDFAYDGFIWTDRGTSGNRFCLYSQVQNTVNFTLAPPDTISVDGDMGRPRFIVFGGGTPDAFTFDLYHGGKYSAWWSSYPSPDGWDPEELASDSGASYLHPAVYFPPYIVAEAPKLPSPELLYSTNFYAWEKQTTSDTSVVFYGADTDSIQQGSNPSMTFVSVPLGPNNYTTFLGFLVWQSDRSGNYHIYSRSFLWAQTGIYEPTRPPKDFLLEQNYPNPFNPSTVISYRLSAVSDVTLKVYDVLGREVATLAEGREISGTHTAIFDGSKFASGVYFYRLTSQSMSIVRKMLLMK